MPSWSQLQFTNHEPIVALRETFVNSTNKLYIVCFWFYISIYCYIPHGSTFGTQGLITSANACISAFSHPFISSPINSLESTKDCKKYFSPPRIHRPISSNDSHVWYSWITVVRNSYVTGCLTILSWTVLNVHRNVVCQSILDKTFQLLWKAPIRIQFYQKSKFFDFFPILFCLPCPKNKWHIMAERTSKVAAWSKDCARHLSRIV